MGLFSFVLCYFSSRHNLYHPDLQLIFIFLVKFAIAWLASGHRENQWKQWLC